MRWVAMTLALACVTAMVTLASAPGPARKPPATTNQPASESTPAGENRGPTGRAIAELRRTVLAQETGRRKRVLLGRSAAGRPIAATASDGAGRPPDSPRERAGRGPVILLFGCIHGTECAGIEPSKQAGAGCPPYGEGIVAVPNLNPDGLSAGTRVNASGVDLNRNFPSGWRPSGAPGDPEHSGRRPFSEPETRLARRLIERLRPDVTIWFHQQAEPLVRAWGPSVPGAKAYARLAGTPFHRVPWLDGTAPNWQNRRFPGTSSFVVELGSGRLPGGEAQRHADAIFRLAREIPPGKG